MKTRILASALLIPFLACLYFGGIALKIAIIFLIAIASDELEKGFNSVNIHPSKTINRIMFIMIVALMGAKAPTYTYVIWAMAAIISSLCYGFKVKDRTLSDITSTCLTSIYPSLFFITLALISDSSVGFMRWYVILIAFGSDIMAYFVGSLIGKHKLCPDLSPKKTWEGAIGGVLGAEIAMIVFNLLVRDEFKIDWIILIIIALLGAVLSELGDLAASALKRQMGIKDYGNLIPGHGGIMDRFDSVLFVSPFIYFITVLITSGDIIF